MSPVQATGDRTRAALDKLARFGLVDRRGDYLVASERATILARETTESAFDRGIIRPEMSTEEALSTVIVMVIVRAASPEAVTTGEVSDCKTVLMTLIKLQLPSAPWDDPVPERPLFSRSR